MSDDIIIHDGRRIKVTLHLASLLPDDDWSAYDADKFDSEPGSLHNIVGWGPTREIAVANLIEALEEA